MHGNRDFLFASEFAKQTGVTLINDPSTLDDSILLSHGDALCTDDMSIKKCAKFCAASLANETLRKSLAERQVFGKGLRAASIANNANKSSAIMDVNASCRYCISWGQTLSALFTVIPIGRASIRLGKDRVNELF